MFVADGTSEGVGGGGDEHRMSVARVLKSTPIKRAPYLHEDNLHVTRFGLKGRRPRA